jgi:1-acyl-sn-glycerol-3-phosphate acyltransferase
LGWRFGGEVPNISKGVLIAAPHTSSWDWPIGMFAILGVGIKVYWLGKAEFVNGRFRPFLTRLGGISVDRSAAHGVVEQTAEQFASREHFLLALAPEGTRSAVARWKLGFYYIAQQAEVPIVPVALDYGRKLVILGPAISAQQNFDAVAQQIADFYLPVRGRNHEKAALAYDQITGPANQVNTG